MNSNGIITAPVTTTDVSTVLCTGSHSLSVLCTHSNINPYAKYKPVKYSNPTPDRNGADKYWWRADDGLCGFTTQVCTSLDEVLNYMKSGASYSYVRPSGGLNSAYRLADFNGYNHQINKGFFENPNLNGVVEIDSTNHAQLSVAPKSSYDPGNDFISFNDLHPINPLTGSMVDANSMYVVAHFIAASSGRLFSVVSPDTFGSMDGFVSLSIPVSLSDLNMSWTYYVFLCEDKDLDFNKVYLPTDIPPTSVSFRGYGTTIDCWLSIRDIENEQGLFTIAFENNTGHYITISSVVCTLRDLSSGEELTFETILNTFGLANGASKTENFSFFFDFDNYQDPDYESSYELEAMITSSTGAKSYATVTFDRYPDGSWVLT